MARRSNRPRGLRPRGKKGILQLRYDYKGYTLEESTGSSDEGEAERIAEEMRVEWRKYVDSGEAAEDAEAHARASITLAEVADAWLETKRHVRPSTWDGYVHKKTMLVRKLGEQGLTALDDDELAEKIQAFITARMGEVQRDTVMDDLEMLRKILLSAMPEESLPKWKTPDKEETGAVHPRAREEGIAVTPEQARKIIRRMPERGRNNKFPQRAWCQLLYETGMRPYEAARLRRGVHWSPGSKVLLVTPKESKIKKRRQVPITLKAQAALTVLYRWSTSRHPDSPFIAPASNKKGVPDVRKPLGHAARAVLTEGNAEAFHSQCFRVSFITREVKRPDVALAELSHMVGQKNSYTQDRYNKTGDDDVQDYWSRQTG